MIGHTEDDNLLTVHVPPSWHVMVPEYLSMVSCWCWFEGVKGSTSGARKSSVPFIFEYISGKLLS